MKNIALFFLLLLFSCGNQSETPIKVANRMKTLACAGEVEGFYSYIDNIAVENNLRRITIESIKEESDSNSQSVKEFQEIVIPSLIVLKWELISRELANGEDGAFCNMQLQNNPDDEYSVEVIFPDGKTSAWNFEQKSDQLLLVSIVDETPFHFAEPDLSLRRDAKSSINLKNEVSIEKVEAKSSEPIDKQQIDTTKSNVASDVENKEKQTLVVTDEAPRKIEKAPEQTNETEKKVSENISRSGYDFGSARWGMNKEQVVALERSSLISDSGNSLKYNGRYNGANARLDYVFSGNKLLSGSYLISSSLADEQAYITNYQKMKKLLTKRYGEPQIDEEIWTNSIYKNNPDRHGFAVYIGHLIYRAKWITARSDIMLELKSNNYNILLEAVYHSR